jgi:DUF1707 SHOCT-like domain
MDSEHARLATVPAAGIRASDADRERMSELLHRHHLEGRLDVSEYQERLGQCLQAKTLGELRGLSADLPEEDPGRPSRATGFSGPAGWRLAIAATVLVALVVGSALAQRPLFFPAVPFLFFWLRGFWWHRSPYRHAALDGHRGRELR